VYKHRPRNTSSPHFPTSRASHTGIVAYNHHIHINPGRSRFLNRHAEIQHIARVIHDNNEHTLVLVHAMQNASSYLLRAWTREDGACDCARQKTGSDERRERGLMAGTASRNNAHL
jgi:ribosomal protein L18